MDDKKRPYKAIVGAVGSGAIAVLALNYDLPVWITILLVFIAAFCVYLVPNPRV